VNRSPRTIEKYVLAARQLTRYLAAEGLPANAAEVRRRDVEGYIAQLLERYKPGTALTRYQDLQQFWKWCVEEGEVEDSPMAKMKPPLLPEVPVLDDDELRALLATCASREFEDLRDQAILRLFLDTGIRNGECAGLDVKNVDIDHDNVALVLGKGRRPRACPFGAKTARAIDRYLRARKYHAHHALPALWLTRFGAMTESGIRQMVKRRGAEAGIEGLHPHVLRHGWAHAWLEARRQRGRPHAPRRMEVAHDAAAVRRVDRRLARTRRTPAPRARGPVVNEEALEQDLVIVVCNACQREGGNSGVVGNEHIPALRDRAGGQQRQSTSSGAAHTLPASPNSTSRAGLGG
jgi:site-specific recombinase XerD